MFRNIRSRYIFAFMVIILVSFLILGLIISSSATNYSLQIKKDTLASAEKTLNAYITSQFQSYGTDDFGSFIYFANVENHLSIMTGAVVTAVNQDIFVIIANLDGVVQLTNRTPDNITVGSVIPAGVTYNVKNSEYYESYSRLEGFFDTKTLIYAETVYSSSGEAAGIIFVCSPTAGYLSFTDRTVKTIIISIVWVSVAALLAVVFISDKITNPLKEMSEAAKSFSQGQFKVRVPVTGKDEIAELATAFNNMAATLEKNEDMRRTFIANISHDLRTPMTTIKGFVDNILSGAIPPEKQDYYLEIISTEVSRLSRLVNSLLDISRMQAGERKFVKAPFDICEMSREIIISLEQRLEAKKLDVRFEPEEENMFVEADRDAIYQVMYNLCDNAIKFSKPGGVYKITHFEREKKVYTSVYNEGQGITPEELPLVFERFYKSDSSRGMDKTGVGLGLYISKTIIDSHNEDMWVTSAYGEYCEFVFTLSVAKEAPSGRKKLHE